MRIALIAGEASGDLLGGALVRALRVRLPGVECYGVTGPHMREAGCASIASIDRLSVMGLVEVLPKLPDILRMRGELYRRLAADRPDCVVGIDAPDFNLRLERRLRQLGIPSVHMVSPTVWAWRQGRVKGIARAVDLILCLFPFEPKFYAGHGVRAEYIGHPLADELASPPSREQARQVLGLPPGPCVAFLPGSRGGELKYMAEPFAATAAWLARRVPGLHCVVPIAKPKLRPLIEQAVAAQAPGVTWHLVDGHSREAMCAADAVLVTSGTATLECLLLDRPMVISYRFSAFNGWVGRRVLKVKHVGLPNLLCAEPVVPELLMEQAVPEQLGPAVLELLESSAARQRQLDQFAAVRKELRRDAAVTAASAIARLVAK